MIYNILLICLLSEFLIGLKSISKAIGFAVGIILLIPSAIKFNFGINLNSFNLAIIVVIVLLLTKTYRNKVVFGRLRDTLLAYYVYIIITSLIVSIGFIPFKEYLQNMILFLMEYGLLIFFLCRIKLKDKEIEWFNKILLFVSLIIIAYALFCYIIKANPYVMYVNLVSGTDDMSELFMQEQRGLLDGRVTSTFVHPLQLGQFVLLVFSYFLFEKQDKVYVIVQIVFLVGLLITAVLTGSRSAIVPIVIAFMIFVLSKKKVIILRTIVISILGGALVFATLPTKIQDHIEGTVLFWDDNAAEKAGIHGSSKESRMDQLASAIFHVNDSFLLGRGFNFHVKHADEYSEDVLGYESIFLSVLIDGGFLGLFVFLLFYYLLYIYLLSQSKSKHNRCRVHALCLSFFVSITLTGISYTMFCFFLILYQMTLYRIVNSHQEMTSEKHCFIRTALG